jgi:hypothetical protein
MNKDKDKEGKDDRILRPSAQEAIGDAAKSNVKAAIEVASSAVTAFVDALVKPSPAKGRKASSRKKTDAPKPRKSRTSARKSASAAGTRKVARAGNKNPTRKASKPAGSAASNARSAKARGGLGRTLARKSIPAGTRKVGKKPRPKKPRRAAKRQPRPNSKARTR